MTALTLASLLRDCASELESLNATIEEQKAQIASLEAQVLRARQKSATYQNLTRPEPVRVQVIEVLPSGRIRAEFPGGLVRVVKASSLHPEKTPLHQERPQ